MPPSPPPQVAEGADEEMEIVFADDPAPAPPTMVMPTTTIYLTCRILNNTGVANGIRDQIVTSLTNAFGQHNHAFNAAPVTQNKKYYENN